MPIINKLSRIHHEKIQQQVKNCDSLQFFDVLNSDQLAHKISSLLPEYRERDYPPTKTLAMFLGQALDADRSCQKAVNTAVVGSLLDGQAITSTNTGAYCRARKRLPTALIAELTRYTGQHGYDQLPQKWLWRGRRVCLVDGTTVSLPDTPENQAVYPQSGTQKKGLGFPLCRLVGITCLASGAILDAAYTKTKGKGSTEQTLIRKICGSFNTGDVVLGDAFYSTYFLLAWLAEKGIDAVFEQHGSRKQVANFANGKRLGAKDHILTYHKPKQPYWMSDEEYAKAPNSIQIREFQAKGKLLITTMLCAKTTSKQALHSLYRERWHVELDFRDLKTTLGMETLSCKTPEMVEKELWVYLLAYNLIRLLMNQAAVLHHRLPRQLSFKHTLQVWVAWRLKKMPMTKEEVHYLFHFIAEKEVGNRPGRVEPRAIKRRPKPMPLLTQTRAEARLNILKNGHPRRLK